MTAHASPSRLIGPALPEFTRHISEPDGQRVLLLGSLPAQRPDLMQMLGTLDITAMAVRSHHELPFRLHHCHPLAIISDLPPESRELSAALRCIAAYDPDMPVLMLTEDAAATLGTIDAAEQLWGLTHLQREPPAAAARKLMEFLAFAGLCQGSTTSGLRLLSVF